MRDDDTRDDMSGAAAHPDRKDDTPSSVPVDGGARGSARLLDRLGALAFRSRNRIDDFGAACQARIADLTSSPLGLRTGRLFARRDVRLGVATGVVCCLGVAAFGASQSEPNAYTAKTDPVSGQAEALVKRATDQAADRSKRQAPVTAPSTPTAKTADPDAPVAPASPAPDQLKAKSKAKSTKPAKPAEVDPGPVAGLDGEQMDNAKAIVRTGRDMGMPRQALIIAVATAMQESNLYNLASSVIPESLRYPHQGTGWDHDSVGLFQQRSSSGWGPVNKLMDPAYATAQFLNALMRVPGWQWMPLTLAAQAVQVSAFPWAYAQHEQRATTVVDAIVPGRK